VCVCNFYEKTVMYRAECDEDTIVKYIDITGINSTSCVCDKGASIDNVKYTSRVNEMYLLLNVII